jgi:hypothetical protein
MNKKRFSIAVSGLLFALGAVPVNAQDFRLPAPENRTQITRLARNLAEEGQSLQRAVRRMPVNNNTLHRQALGFMTDFAQRARQFDNQVNRYFNNPRRGLDFGALYRSYTLADQNIRYIQNFNFIQDEWRRASRTMGELTVALRQGTTNPRWNPQQAVNISLRIENFAEQAVNLAWQELRTRIIEGDYYRALYDLQRLEAAADSLNDKISANRNNPSASRGEFNTLTERFNQAMQSVDRVQFRNAVHTTLRNLRAEIQALTRMYQGEGEGELDRAG